MNPGANIIPQDCHLNLGLNPNLILPEFYFDLQEMTN